MPFDLYTVAETAKAVTVSAGMKIEPNYTFDNAPAPKVIVIPAQGGDSKRIVDWIKSSSQHADLTMSVCTGAFVLAETGLLAGKPATTHHDAYREFAWQYPDIQAKRGARFVDVGKVATAGGLSSGIEPPPCTWSSATSDARSPPHAALRMTWSIRGKAGPTRNPTPCTRWSRFQRTSIRCVRCARWTLILRERRSRRTKERPITFARPAIKRALMPRRENWI